MHPLFHGIQEVGGLIVLVFMLSIFWVGLSKIITPGRSIRALSHSIKTKEGRRSLYIVISCIYIFSRFFLKQFKLLDQHFCNQSQTRFTICGFRWLAHRLEFLTHPLPGTPNDYTHWCYSPLASLRYVAGHR